MTYHWACLSVFFQVVTVSKSQHREMNDFKKMEIPDNVIIHLLFNYVSIHWCLLLIVSVNSEGWGIVKRTG